MRRLVRLLFMQPTEMAFALLRSAPVGKSTLPTYTFKMSAFCTLLTYSIQQFLFTIIEIYWLCKVLCAMPWKNHVTSHQNAVRTHNFYKSKLYYQKNVSGE